MNNTGRKNSRRSKSNPNKMTKIKLKNNWKQTTTTECRSKNVTKNVLETTLKNQKNNAENNVLKGKDETNRKLQKCSMLKIKTNFKLLRCESLLRNQASKNIIFKISINKSPKIKLHNHHYQVSLKTFLNIITLKPPIYSLK